MALNRNQARIANQVPASGFHAVRIDDRGLDLLFRQARTHNGWLAKPVSDELLVRIYDLMK